MKLKWKVMAPSTTPAAARSCHQFISWHHGFNKPPQIFRVSQDQHSHYFFPDYPPPHLPWFGLSGSCNLINRMGVAKKKTSQVYPRIATRLGTVREQELTWFQQVVGDSMSFLRFLHKAAQDTGHFLEGSPSGCDVWGGWLNQVHVRTETGSQWH